MHTNIDTTDGENATCAHCGDPGSAGRQGHERCSADACAWCGGKTPELDHRFCGIALANLDLGVCGHCGGDTANGGRHDECVGTAGA